MPRQAAITQPEPRAEGDIFSNTALAKSLRKSVSVLTKFPASLPAAEPNREGRVVGNNPVDKLSSSEQLILELVNRERLAAGLEPVASVSQLNAAAQKHSEWMAAGRRLDHTGAGGSSPWDRMKAEGWTEYPMGENIAYNPFNQSRPAPGEYVPQNIIEDMHAGWMNSSGHRANILNAGYTVLGVGDAIGGHPRAPGNATDYATQNFAGTTRNYVTGVVYDDADKDKFYDMGEGLGSATVAIVNSSGLTVATSTTDPGGGYSIALADGTYTARFSGDGINGTIEKRFTISGKNRKVDVLDANAGEEPPAPPVGTDGNDVIHFSNGDGFWENGVARNVGRAGIDTLVVNEGSVFKTSGLSWYGFERFIGASGNDHVRGNLDTVDYFLQGNGGNDTLIGAGGDDTLIGGTGRDTMQGGAGNDTVQYGAGDVFWKNGRAIDVGGAGMDTLQLEDGATFRTNGLSWYGFERFVGAGGSDSIRGNNDGVDYVLNGGGGNDTLIGAGGDDTLRGAAGRDTLFGGGGNDTIFFGTGDHFWENGRARNVGGTGTDTLRVEEGATFKTNGLSWYGFERFIGSAGGDTVKGNSKAVDYFLNGGGGNDVLGGAGGDDTLVGGAGADIFVFGNAWGADKITDFADGTDQIDLSGVSGLDSLDDLSITERGGNVLISFAGNSIELVNVTGAQIGAADFIL